MRMFTMVKKAKHQGNAMANLRLKEWPPVKNDPIASTGLSPMPTQVMDIFPS